MRHQFSPCPDSSFLQHDTAMEPADQPTRNLIVDLARSGAPTVLWVDDDLFFLTLAEQTLRLRGFNTLMAQSAAEALMLLERALIDSVVLDYHLPDMNGLDLAQRVKTRWPDMPLFLYSGMVCHPDYQSLFQATFQKGSNCMDQLVQQLSALREV